MLASPGSQGSEISAIRTFSGSYGASRALTVQGALAAFWTRLPWWQKYRILLLLSDLTMILVALTGASYAAFGTGPGVVAVGTRSASPAAVVIVMAAIWLLILSITRSRHKRVLGAGSEEFRKVLGASLAAAGTVATIAHLAGAELARSYFVVGLSAGLVLLLAGRLVLRVRLRTARKRGAARAGVVIIGDEDDVAHVLDEFSRAPAAAYQPIAVSVTGQAATPEPTAARTGRAASLPQVRGDELGRVARDPRVEAVVVAGDLDWNEVRELAWGLEGSRVELLLASRLTDVAHPRLHLSPVDVLPMVHVDLPQFGRAQRAGKRVLDVVLSAMALVLLFPFFLVIALAIRLTDGGPAIFRQERIGQNGEPFTMHKFRTMSVDAESRMADLIERAGGSPLWFKLRNDPRVTPVGRVLRTYSLDELPQFWDVLLGRMSVVGPRPQVAREVAQYTRPFHRRLLTKPGITGLWQVSGRSELSVEASVALDLWYVENRSLTGDLVLVLKTVKAVLRPGGAY